MAYSLPVTPKNSPPVTPPVSPRSLPDSLHGSLNASPRSRPGTPDRSQESPVAPPIAIPSGPPNSIKLALDAGKLSFFEPFLNVREYDSWPSFLEIIERMANPHAPPKREHERELSKTERLIFELFVIAVDGDINQESKKQIFQEKLSELTEAEYHDFVGHVRDILPIVSIHIMRYAGNEFMTNAVKGQYEHNFEAHAEKKIVGWLRALQDSKWENQESTFFLNTLF